MQPEFASRALKVAHYSESRQWLTLAAPFMGFLFFWYVLAPPLPIENTNVNFDNSADFVDIDPSWQIAITKGFLSGAKFGRDLIFTYGPWGFVSEARGDPRIYPWLFCSRLLLAISLTASAALIAARRIDSRMGRWLWMAAVVLTANPVSIVAMPA